MHRCFASRRSGKKDKLVGRLKERYGLEKEAKSTIGCSGCNRNAKPDLVLAGALVAPPAGIVRAEDRNEAAEGARLGARVKKAIIDVTGSGATGTAHAAGERLRAVQDVRNVPGVHGVTEEIRVVPAEARATR